MTNAAKNFALSPTHSRLKTIRALPIFTLTAFTSKQTRNFRGRCLSQQRVTTLTGVEGKHFRLQKHGSYFERRLKYGSISDSREPLGTL